MAAMKKTTTLLLSLAAALTLGVASHASAEPAAAPVASQASVEVRLDLGAVGAILPLPKFYSNDGCTLSRGGAFVMWNGTVYCRGTFWNGPYYFRAVISGGGQTSTGPWRKIGGGQSSTTGYIAWPGGVYADKG